VCVCLFVCVCVRVCVLIVVGLTGVEGMVGVVRPRSIKADDGGCVFLAIM
jgi:hypothetical protein